MTYFFTDIFSSFSFVLFHFSFPLFFPLFLRRLDTEHGTVLKSRVKPTTTVQALENWSKSVTFLTWTDLLTGRVIWWWLEEGGEGEGRSRMRLINSRLRPFNKLRCFHGIPSIKMCYEHRRRKGGGGEAPPPNNLEGRANIPFGPPPSNNPPTFSFNVYM